MSSKTVYTFTIEGLRGGEIDLKAFEGKNILIVNVASACGFTPQYEQLQDMYKQFNEQLMVIGCPCNQFGGQEPGTAEDIAAFCDSNYGISFPISQKLDVKGPNQHPLYKWLSAKSETGVLDTEVQWNFHKFVIDRHGRLKASYPSNINPASDEILSALGLL